MSHAELTQMTTERRVRAFPAPNGCARLVGVTTSGEWVQERLCLIEDVTPTVLEEMEAVVRQHEP